MSVKLLESMKTPIGSQIRSQWGDRTW